MKSLRQTATTVITGLGVLMFVAAPGFAGGNHGAANDTMANANRGFWYSDHMEWSWMSGMHGSFWPLMIILLVAILLVAFYLGTRDARPHETVTASSSRRRPGSARDILDERYARGEIDRSEYLESKRELS